MATRRQSAKEPVQKDRPMLSPEAREQRMIGYAVDLAEKQLREGTASSQVITEYLKRGSKKQEYELEKLRHENELLKVKTEAIQSSQRSEEFYQKVIDAMKVYSGGGVS